jgi:hypothetical protein
MLLNQRLSSLKFDDYVFIDPEIRVILSHNLTDVNDLYRFLLLHREAESIEFDAESILIHFFEKPRTQSVVDLIRITDDLLCEDIVFQESSDKYLDRIYRINKDITR